MPYFSDDFLHFFKELKSHNNKRWFDAHRQRYEEAVKKPFTIFIEDLIKTIQKQEPDIQLLAKQALLRINRDIRFSKDKTSYHTSARAIISQT